MCGRVINSQGPVPEAPREVWTQKIPEYLSHVSDHSNYRHHGRYHSRRSQLDEIVPPAVPRQLEKPFLNQNHVQKDDQSVLPNPAFVWNLRFFLVEELTVGCVESSWCCE